MLKLIQVTFIIFSYLSTHAQTIEFEELPRIPEFALSKYLETSDIKIIKDSKKAFYTVNDTTWNEFEFVNDKDKYIIDIVICENGNIIFLLYNKGPVVFKNGEYFEPIESNDIWTAGISQFKDYVVIFTKDKVYLSNDGGENFQTFETNENRYIDYQYNDEGIIVHLNDKIQYYDQQFNLIKEEKLLHSDYHPYVKSSIISKNEIATYNSNNSKLYYSNDKGISYDSIDVSNDFSAIDFVYEMVKIDTYLFLRRRDKVSRINLSKFESAIFVNEDGYFNSMFADKSSKQLTLTQIDSYTKYNALNFLPLNTYQPDIKNAKATKMIVGTDSNIFAMTKHNWFELKENAISWNTGNKQKAFIIDILIDNSKELQLIEGNVETRGDYYNDNKNKEKYIFNLPQNGSVASIENGNCQDTWGRVNFRDPIFNTTDSWFLKYCVPEFGAKFHVDNSQVYFYTNQTIIGTTQTGFTNSLMTKLDFTKDEYNFDSFIEAPEALLNFRKSVTINDDGRVYINNIDEETTSFYSDDFGESFVECQPSPNGRVYSHSGTDGTFIIHEEYSNELERNISSLYYRKNVSTSYFRIDINFENLHKIHDILFDSLGTMYMLVDNGRVLKSTVEHINLNTSSFKDEKWRDELTIFPNPVNNFINIKGLNQGNHVSLKIVNAKGSTIRDIDIYNNTISTQGLIEGVYFLHIINQDQVIIKKFIVNR